MERNRNRDLTLSVREPNPETVKKAKLNIDEDSFDIIYDIHQYEQCKYLYIKKRGYFAANAKKLIDAGCALISSLRHSMAVAPVV